MEDKYSAEIYKKAGYINIVKMERIYRLDYLNRVVRDSINPDYVLIAPGLHDGVNMMNSILEVVESNNNTTFLLKPHPRANNEYVLKYNKLRNLEVTSSSIIELLSVVSKVYATYSSVAIEAYILGIKLELYDVPGKINESPLCDNDYKDSISSLYKKNKSVA